MELKGVLSSEDFSFRFECGYNKPDSHITMETRQEFINAVSLHYALYHVRAEVNQLKRGMLDTLHFGHLVKEHPIEMWSLLAVNKVDRLTAQQVEDLFVVEFSPQGSNDRVEEEAAIMH